jgi:hypothetical protein
MHKANISERAGNRFNENLPAWYKEKVKAMAEIIMKKIEPDNSSIQSTINAEVEKDVVVR